jgi:hypothetical protein
MKTTKTTSMKKNVLVAFALIVSAAAFAIDPVNPKLVVMSSKNTGVFKVIYEGAQAGPVKMNVLNQSGKLVFTETIKGVDGFVRPVNFNGMEAGEYTIEIVDAAGKQIQKVNFTNESTVKNVHVAKITGGESKYLLAVANDAEETINVRIFDGNNNQVHEENVKVAGNFGLVYNLKNVTGTPTFEVTDKTGNTKVIRY